MDFSKIKSEAKKIGKEMIPVVLGILIALWINTWQQNQKNRKFLNHVFQTIQEEHEENIKELKAIIPTHEKLIDSIYHYTGDETIFIGQFPNMVGGLSVALIGNTSRKSFINNQIQLVDFKIIKLLSTIDNLSDAYKRQTKRMADFFFENINEKSQRQKDILLFIIEDLSVIEEDLLESHIELEKILQNEIRK